MHSSNRQARDSAVHSPGTRARAILDRLVETTRRHWALLSPLARAQSRACDGAVFEDHLKGRLVVHRGVRGLRFDDVLAPAWEREPAPEDGMLIWIELQGLDAIARRGRDGIVDELRGLVCERISAYMATDEDPIGCYGGRSFVCLRNSIRSRARAISFVDGLLKALSMPCRLAGTQVRLRPILGVACFPRDGTNATILLMHAAAAMRRARRDASGYAFHSPLLDAAFATVPPAIPRVALNRAHVGTISDGASISLKG